MNHIHWHIFIYEETIKWKDTHQYKMYALIPLVYSDISLSRWEEWAICFLYFQQATPIWVGGMFWVQELVFSEPIIFWEPDIFVLAQWFFWRIKRDKHVSTSVEAEWKLISQNICPSLTSTQTTWPPALHHVATSIKCKKCEGETVEVGFNSKSYCVSSSLNFSQSCKNIHMQLHVGV